MNIYWGNGLIAHRIIRGGKPAVGKVLTVQQADNRGLKFAAIRNRKPDRVKVLEIGPEAYSVSADRLICLKVEWLRDEA